MYILDGMDKMNNLYPIKTWTHLVDFHKFQNYHHKSLIVIENSIE